MTNPAGISEPLPIAFYAPMKPPTHPTPSGDRKMARLLFDALRQAGMAPELASEFRSHSAKPDPERFAALKAEGAAEAARLIEIYQARPPERRPKLWFTYHLYYKAPDHLGPRVAAALGASYVVAEASRSPKRLQDGWAESAADAEAGLDLADVILCLTERDRPALVKQLLSTQHLEMFPPFLDAGRRPPPKPNPTPPFRLLTVAMMRPGDKLDSYRTLAAALTALSARGGPEWVWEIVGDGPALAEVAALTAPLGDRVRLLGRVDEEAKLRALYSAAHLLVWPGVGEAFGMSYLEAKAMQTAALAEDRPGVRDVLSGGGGRMVPPDRPDLFADAIAELLSNPAALLELGREGRADVSARHGLDAAA
ncbi:MAG: glycosyltransferase family 4 protein, partial [Rhodobacteraceae bacterium]|nr:glycosyltransferase family 4 protein [Paracoccaceae bacterium]